MATSDAAGGSGLPVDTGTMQLLTYAGIAVGVLIVGGIVYYFVTTPRAAPPSGGA